MEVFQPSIEAYLAKTALLGEPPHPVFEKMRVHGNRRNFPIIGPEAGRFFLQLAAIRRPKRVLELGSGFGYSALWWAFGHRDAEIHLTDFKRSNLDEAAGFAKEAGVESQLVYHEGSALGIAEDLDGSWDIIFCDIDKQQYPKAVDFAGRMARPGDLLLFDNMLWHGKVAISEDAMDDQTLAVIEATRRLYTSSNWAASLLPIRDGILMALRV